MSLIQLNELSIKLYLDTGRRLSRIREEFVGLQQALGQIEIKSGPEVCARLNTTLGRMEDHLHIFTGSQQGSDPLTMEFRDSFVHEMCHLFGELTHGFYYLACEMSADPSNQELMERLHHYTTSLQAIDDEFRRISDLGRPTVIHTFSLFDAVHESCRHIARYEREIRLELLPYAAGDDRYKGNERGLITALFCLFQNSIEALKAAGRPDPFIRAAISREDGWVITITDNGAGILEELAGKVFEPYFTTKAEQAGIGLFFAKTIIETELKGRISFHCNEGLTTFIIKLNDGNKDHMGRR